MRELAATASRHRQVRDPGFAAGRPWRAREVRLEGAPRARIGVVLVACRPRQWVKNALVAIAPAAAGVLTDPATDLRVLAVVVRPALGLVAIAYMALTTTYSLWWRDVVVADIVAIAGGFVLRGCAGAFAAGVPISRSFLLAISGCALFLAAGKRYAELTNLGRGPASRATLRRYSRSALRKTLIVVAVLASLAYVRWAFARPAASAWFELSAIPFVMWLVRYGVKLSAGDGEAPEELILGDRLLVVLSSAWALTFIGGVYGSP